jgi:hypothetical protein
MIPYKFDEGAASKIANKLGSAASSAIQFRGKYKAGPLAAQEAEEKKSKDETDAKAKSDATHSDRVARAKELSVARASGAVSREKARQSTIGAQTKLSETRAKEKATPRAVTPKPAGQVTPAKKKAANPAAKLTPAKTTVKTRDDNTSVGRSVPGIFKPTNPSTNKPKKPKTSVMDSSAAERYTD